MPKFMIKKIEAISGIQEIRQLVILDDREDVSNLKLEELNGQWDLYSSGLEKRYISFGVRILAIMNKLAKGESLPYTQFHEITPKGELVKEYEFKAGDLRVYAIKSPNGKIVVLGGYKNQQKADIRKFQSIKKQYLASIKTKQS